MSKIGRIVASSIIIACIEPVGQQYDNQKSKTVKFRRCIYTLSSCLCACAINCSMFDDSKTRILFSSLFVKLHNKIECSAFYSIICAFYCLLTVLQESLLDWNKLNWHCRTALRSFIFYHILFTENFNWMEDLQKESAPGAYCLH